MTTAHRPTFDPARGGSGKQEGALSSMSKQYSARDLPGHKTLKYRQEGQSTQEEVRSRDAKRDLEEREFAAISTKDSSKRSISSSAAPSTSAAPSKKSRPEPSANPDADDPVDEDSDSSASSAEEEDDDTEELMRELEKIRKERALEAARQEAAKRAEEERIRTENIVRGNPLLNQTQKEAADFKVRRRWDDDSVFKNCARDQDSGRGFVNDMLRTEFHKKFMDKYIK